MAELKFEITETLGTIGEGSKVDIRDWDESHQKMGKGLTLTKEELKSLKELLNSIDIDDLDI